MKEYSCRELRRSLERQVLGELAPQEQDALDRHMESCRSCRQIHQSWLDFGELLRSAPLPPMPPLQERRALSGAAPVEPPSSARNRRSAPRLVLAAAALLFLGTLLASLSHVTGPWGPLDARQDSSASVARSAAVAPPTPPRQLAATTVQRDFARRIAGVAPGTSLFVAQDARVQVLRNDSQRALFTLDAGYVLAEIGANAPGFRFVVETPQARVMAWGTVFSVSVSSTDGETYRVLEGHVKVEFKNREKSAITLPAGSQMQLDAPWPTENAGYLAATTDDTASPTDDTSTPLTRGPALQGDHSAGPRAMPQDEPPSSREEPSHQPPLPAPELRDTGQEPPVVQETDQRVEARQIEILTRRAEAEQMSRRFPAACDSYLEIIRSFPDNPAAGYSLVAIGQMKLDSMAQPGESLTYFQAYLDRSPSGMLAEEARLGSVRALAQQERWSEVPQSADAFLEQHPDSRACAEVLRLRADARRKTGQCHLAVQDYRELMARWPDSPHAAMGQAGLADCQESP